MGALLLHLQASKLATKEEVNLLLFGRSEQGKPSLAKLADGRPDNKRLQVGRPGAQDDITVVVMVVVGCNLPGRDLSSECVRITMHQQKHGHHLRRHPYHCSHQQIRPAQATSHEYVCHYKPSPPHQCHAHVAFRSAGRYTQGQHRGPFLPYP
jgi:hypothetical protein